MAFVTPNMQNIYLCGVFIYMAMFKCFEGLHKLVNVLCIHYANTLV